MLRLVGVTIPDDVDLFNGLRMIKGLDTKNSRSKIEALLTKAGLYNRQLQPNGKLEKVYPQVGSLSWKQKSRLIDILEIPRAVIRNVRISPRKLRLVADQIRGKSVDEALGILQFLPKGGSPILLKLLKSAIANAGSNHDLRADDLYVAKITVDGGPTMKRFMARARGRACRILKRTSHATIVLREKFSMATITAAETSQAAATKKAVKKTTKPANKAAKAAPKAEKAPANKPADKTTKKTQGGKE
jgi:large subunit ribosomal protein L22